MYKKIKETHKDYNANIELVNNLKFNTNCSLKSNKIYYSIQSKVITFYNGKEIIKHDIKNKTFEIIDNPHNTRTATHLSNLNKVFKVLADNATAKPFNDAMAITEHDTRYNAIVDLANNPLFETYCTKSKYKDNTLMIAKNFFNHGGSSHGKESSRVNKDGISNFRNNGILTSWLKGNPTAKELIPDVISNAA